LRSAPDTINNPVEKAKLNFIVEKTMAATAVHPFDYQAEGQPAPAEENQFVQMPAPAEENQFVQMRDDQPPMHPDDGMMYMNEEEALAIEKRGRRLRRAALATGILSVLSIVCMIYTTIAVRWVIVDWTHAELTAYSIADNMVAFKIGILCDVAMIILQTFIGVLISMILIGAGVNPAMSIMAAVFKIMQLAIMGANVIHLFVASILLDRDLAISSTITNTFFSSYSAQDSIGTNLVYLFLVMNKYGNIFAQGKIMDVLERLQDLFPVRKLTCI
jgi:hypothetical protein